MRSFRVLSYGFIGLIKQTTVPSTCDERGLFSGHLLNGRLEKRYQRDMHAHAENVNETTCMRYRGACEAEKKRETVTIARSEFIPLSLIFIDLKSEKWLSDGFNELFDYRSRGQMSSVTVRVLDHVILTE